MNIETLKKTKKDISNLYCIYNKLQPHFNSHISNILSVLLKEMSNLPKDIILEREETLLYENFDLIRDFNKYSNKCYITDFIATELDMIITNNLVLQDDQQEITNYSEIIY